MTSRDASVPVLDGTELLAAAAVREALPEEFSLPLRRWHLSTRHDAGASLPARRQ